MTSSSNFQISQNKICSAAITVTLKYKSDHATPPHTLPGTPPANSKASGKGPLPGFLVLWHSKCGLWTPGRLQDPLKVFPRSELVYNNIKTLFAFFTGLIFAGIVRRQRENSAFGLKQFWWSVYSSPSGTLRKINVSFTSAHHWRSSKY